VQAVPYVDRVINEKEAADESLAEGGGQEPEPRGRRSFSAIYGLSDARYSNGTRYREQGVELRGQRETLDYGTFDYIAAGFAAEDTFGAGAGLSGTFGGQRGGERLTLSQSRFALNGSQLADSAIGAVYTQGSSLVSRSFRNSLISSPVLGVSTRIYNNAGTEFNFSSGRIGQFSGTGGSGFRATQGEMTGLGLQRRIDGQWAFGSQAWTVKGASGVADHTSMGLAGDYASPDGVRRLQLRGILDDHGRGALWFDGEYNTPTLLHRYGVFRYQQDVAWADYPIASGQQGLYWRADARGFGRGYSMGAEYQENNFQHNALQPVTRSALAFGTVNQRIDRLSSVGGTLNLRMSQTIGAAALADPAANTNNTRIEGLTFAAHQTALGTTRLQLTYGGSVRGGRDRTYGTQWDQDFNSLALATSLAYTDEYTEISGRARRTTAALLFRGFSFGSATLSGNLNIYQLRAENRAAETGTQAGASLRWLFGRHWSLQSTLSWRRTRNADLSALGTPPGDEQLLMVYLRYDAVGGIPYYASNTRGPTASARVAGLVFYDENADGVQQAAEKPAAGVTITLDGSYRAVTDANGRFEFAPVSPGPHKVMMQPDRIPLPWGLLDEAPRAAQAPVRGDVQVVFPLVRLNQ
jgi:hypothetical protein